MKHLAVALACVVIAAGAARAAGPLDVFAPLCGKTWQGEFTGPDGERMTDVSHWELILGGKAVRTVHSLNNGVYGGESLLFWDAEKETLAFVYVTTAGFRTEGTIAVDGKTFTSNETVHGDADGITEVRASSRLGDDGTLEVASEYLKDGAWVPGHVVIYEEAPQAEVRFQRQP
jgi:hypothetical protein